MDATDDRDVLLQRASADLLFELRTSLPRFLYKKPGRSGTGPKLRRHLEPFQEWPQLLDSQLDALVSPLSEALLQSIPSDKARLARLRRASVRKQPLVQAICRLLYAFCKVRGPNVVSRFLSNEPKSIGPIVGAFEIWSKIPPSSVNGSRSTAFSFVWEEKYIFLLWLAHLLLAPFSLSTITSDLPPGKLEVSKERTDELLWPPTLPTIAARLVEVAVSNIRSAGKERDAATSMLVRLVLRPDMQRLQLHEVLVRWSIDLLKADVAADPTASHYRSIGLLFFLAQLVKSADATHIAPYLLFIFSSVRELNILQSNSSSALARRAIIKLHSAISVASLRLDSSTNYDSMNISSLVLEEAINDLLIALGDSDTPVRQAASKALSVITTDLDPQMSAEISEAIIGGLDEDVLWDNVPELLPDGSETIEPRIVKQMNLTAVNPLRWQGLVLTLSHLLFRRSLPVVQLPAILNSLILALSFEQRSSAGAALGSNVRDAACFGIWALARGYSSEELSGVETTNVVATRIRNASASILQVLAVELVVAATTDPSGNIRRGASAALQELVGRHPDTVHEGISLVQAVDYHAVALRSRAMTEVAAKAAGLGRLYWWGILRELTTWRGIGAYDIESRKLAAEAVGLLANYKDRARILEVTKELWQSLNGLDASNVPKRQGFMLSLGALVKAAQLTTSEDQSTMHVLQRQWDIFSEGLLLTEKDFTLSTLRPELTAEGASCLIEELACACSGESARLKKPTLEILRKCLRYLDLALSRKERVVNERAAAALKVLLGLLPVETRKSWLQQSISKCKALHKVTISGSFGHLYALGALHSNSLYESAFRANILETILETIRSAKDIDARIVATRSLIVAISKLDYIHTQIVPTLQTALQDYTTDQRGDVGSVLRLEAIEAVLVIGRNKNFHLLDQRQLLLEAIATLAAEKLDKVRYQAWHCISSLWEQSESVGAGFAEHSFYPAASSPDTKKDVDRVDIDQVTSHTYFSQVLELSSFEPLVPSLFRGLSTSVGSGSESVLVASRSALSAYVQTLRGTRLQSFCEYFEEALRDSLTVERLVVPMLESIAFLLDMNQVREGQDQTFRWRKLLALVQKAHYKSTNVSKLQAALEVYGGLGQVASVRNEVLKKLCSLLKHPFPKIRNASADTLFTLTQNEELLPVDWSRPPRETKGSVINIQAAIV